MAGSLASFPAATGREIDIVLDCIETCLKKVDASQTSIVKLVKAETDLLCQLETLRNSVQQIISSGDRVLLREVFGNNCERVARPRIALQSVRLSEMSAKDQRFSTCERACTALEDMLTKLGIVDDLAKAREGCEQELMLHRAAAILADLPAEPAEALEGWLCKRGPTREYKFVKRWCVLRDVPPATCDGAGGAVVLDVFTDESRQQSKGTLDLQQRTRCVNFDAKKAIGDAVKHKREKPFGFVLDLNTAGGKDRILHYFDAEDGDQRQAWCHAIVKLVHSRWPPEGDEDPEEADDEGSEEKEDDAEDTDACDTPTASPKRGAKGRGAKNAPHSPEEEARSLFQWLDVDKDGVVTKHELKRAVQKSGKDGAKVRKALRVKRFKDCMQVIQEADVDKNGSLDFSEFQAYLLKLRGQVAAVLPPPPTALDDTAVQKAFAAMDANGDGRLTYEELKLAYAGILLSTGEQVTKKRVARWATRNLANCDRDGNAALDINEFRELLKRSGTLASALMPSGDQECSSATISQAREADALPPAAVKEDGCAFWLAAAAASLAAVGHPSAEGLAEAAAAVSQGAPAT